MLDKIIGIIMAQERINAKFVKETKEFKETIAELAHNLAEKMGESYAEKKKHLKDFAEAMGYRSNMKPLADNIEVSEENLERMKAILAEKAFLIGSSYFASGDRTFAPISWYGIAEKCGYEPKKVFLALGEAHMAIDNLNVDSAISYFRSALTSGHENPFYIYTKIAEAYTKRALYARNQAQEIQASLSSRTEENEANPLKKFWHDKFAQKAENYSEEMSDKFFKAIENYRKASAFLADPKFISEIYERIAKIHFCQSNFKDAVTTLQEAKQLEGDFNEAGIDQRIGECYLKLGDYTSAIRAFNSALSSKGEVTKSVIYTFLVVAELKQDNIIQAKTIFANVQKAGYRFDAQELQMIGNVCLEKGLNQEPQLFFHHRFLNNDIHLFSHRVMLFLLLHL